MVQDSHLRRPIERYGLATRCIRLLCQPSGRAALRVFRPGGFYGVAVSRMPPTGNSLRLPGAFRLLLGPLGRGLVLGHDLRALLGLARAVALRALGGLEVYALLPPVVQRLRVVPAQGGASRARHHHAVAPLVEPVALPARARRAPVREPARREHQAEQARLAPARDARVAHACPRVAGGVGLHGSVGGDPRVAEGVEGDLPCEPLLVALRELAGVVAHGGVDGRVLHLVGEGGALQPGAQPGGYLVVQLGGDLRRQVAVPLVQLPEKNLGVLARVGDRVAVVSPEPRPYRPIRRRPRRLRLAAHRRPVRLHLRRRHQLQRRSPPGSAAVRPPA